MTVGKEQLSRNPAAVVDRVMSMLAAVEPLLLWVLSSLLAIAIVGTRPHLALVIAGLGGAATGLSSLAVHQTLRPTVPHRADEDSARDAATLTTPHLLRLEIACPLLAAPLLMYPSLLSAVALLILVLPWLARWKATGHPTLRTPVDIPILCLLLMVPVSLWASALPALSLPRLLEILLGVAFFYALVNGLRTSEHLHIAARVLTLLGAGLALGGLLSTRWITDKVYSLPDLYARLPQLLPETIHPNVLAGALVMLIPLATALLLHTRGSPSTSAPRRLQRVLPGLSLVVTIPVLVLTQSRGGYFAVLAGLIVVALATSRWTLISLPVALAGSLVVLRRVEVQQVMNLLLSSGALGGWEGRREVWSRAVYMLQDFPYTGIGVGTFSRVGPVMYPYFILGPDADVPHAHNLFLQLGVDLGIPGLVAFVALLVASGVMTWRAYRAFHGGAEQNLAGVALGLLAGLVGMVTHGMVDAATWGTKPSVIPWVFVGLAAVAYRASTRTSHEYPRAADTATGRAKGGS